MREIKFRGKRLNGQWVYGLLCHDPEKGKAYDSEWFISNKAGKPYAFAIAPSTIGQYTGLKDHHGKEIYEGDIVRATSLSISTLGAFRDTIVKYNSDAGAYILVCGNRSSYLYVMAEHVLEIIGNIHETQN